MPHLKGCFADADLVITYSLFEAGQQAAAANKTCIKIIF